MENNFNSIAVANTDEIAEVDVNQFSFQGILLERQPIRFTPAGIAICEGIIGHRSWQMENNQKRLVRMDLPFIIIGHSLSQMVQLIEINAKIWATGFLAKKSLKSNKCIFHINALKNF